MLTLPSDLSGQVAELRRQVQQARASLRVTRAEVAKLTKENKRWKQSVLLGELAYVVDDATCKFVYGQAADRTIQDVFMDPDLTPDQKERLHAFKAFLQTQEFDPADAKHLPNLVRVARIRAGEDKSTATESMLQTWGRSIVEEDSQEELQKLMQLAALFSRPGQPLMMKSQQEITDMIISRRGTSWRCPRSQG